MQIVENLYTTDCIRTYSGKYVNVFEPQPEMFCIEDIAHALSQMPRFGGHLKHFYSVAQHSINCLQWIEDQFKFDALMHDCSEAYLMDIPRPIKNRMPQYKEIENGLMIVLSDIFGFNYPLPERVKEVDEMVLGIEWHNLMLSERHVNRKMEDMENDFIEIFNQYKNAL